MANIQVKIKYIWLKSEKSVLDKRKLIIGGTEVLGNGCDHLPMGGEEERPATRSRNYRHKDVWNIKNIKDGNRCYSWILEQRKLLVGNAFRARPEIMT